MNYVLVFAGGGTGALLRYLVQLLAGKHTGTGFPISTFLVNITGCLAIGILASLAVKMKWNEPAVLFMFTGVLGGFTTFSSFSIEFFNLIKNNQTGMALLYLGLSNFAGLALSAGGYHLVK